LLFVKRETPYYGCPNCSFRFARPKSNPNFENRLQDFDAAYLQYLRPEPADAKNFGALCRWMERFGQLAGNSLLDVGCGSGKLVRYLRGHGVNACGVEPNDALFDHFLAGESCFVRGTVQGASVLPQQFDIITAFDVMEHVDDPAGLIEHLVGRLSAGGRLYLSTPDAGSTPARLLGRRWHFYNRYHLSYFSPRTLEVLASRFGLASRHYSWRGRYRSLGYTLRYGFGAVTRRCPPSWLRRLDRITLPINLFDTMYSCFQKPAVSESVRPSRVHAERRLREIA